MCCRFARQQCLQHVGVRTLVDAANDGAQPRHQLRITQPYRNLRVHRCGDGRNHAGQSQGQRLQRPLLSTRPIREHYKSARTRLQVVAREKPCQNLMSCKTMLAEIDDRLVGQQLPIPGLGRPAAKEPSSGSGMVTVKIDMPFDMDTVQNPQIGTVLQAVLVPAMRLIVLQRRRADPRRDRLGDVGKRLQIGIFLEIVRRRFLRFPLLRGIVGSEVCDHWANLIVLTGHRCRTPLPSTQSQHPRSAVSGLSGIGRLACPTRGRRRFQHDGSSVSLPCRARQQAAWKA